jgi:hypothetical protein
MGAEAAVLVLGWGEHAKGRVTASGVLKNSNRSERRREADLVDFLTEGPRRELDATIAMRRQHHRLRWTPSPRPGHLVQPLDRASR